MVFFCAVSVERLVFHLDDDHLADGHHDGVVNLDVSLLDGDAVDGAVGDGEGVARDGGELGAVRHVGEAVGALDNVGTDDLGDAVVVEQIHLGHAELAGELSEGIVVGTEDGEGAGGGEAFFEATLLVRRWRDEGVKWREEDLSVSFILWILFFFGGKDVLWSSFWPDFLERSFRCGQKSRRRIARTMQAEIVLEGERSQAGVPPLRRLFSWRG